MAYLSSCPNFGHHGRYQGNCGENVVTFGDHQIMVVATSATFYQIRDVNNVFVIHNTISRMTSVIIGQILASLGHFWVIKSKSESAFASKPSDHSNVENVDNPKNRKQLASVFLPQKAVATVCVARPLTFFYGQDLDFMKSCQKYFFKMISYIKTAVFAWPWILNRPSSSF
jgi:hypothetical protein